MKAILLLSFICSLSVTIQAQSDSLKWVNEINEQVWKPFTAHLISGDKAAFASVHSKEITRVQIDDGILLDYQKYFPVDTAQKQGRRKGKFSFELRFDKRISNGVSAWESGFYKGEFMQEGKPPHVYYGRFFVFLRKENGTWKIWVDADTGKDATEENFSKAIPIQ